MRQADIIVIGAGVLGTFHAYFAAQKGYNVLLIERNSLPSSASTRNFGMVVQTIVETDNEWAGYARATAEIYRALQREYDISLRNAGSLYLASTEIEKVVLMEFAQRFGAQYHCTLLDKGETLARYPFVQAPYCSGSLYFSDDLSIEPRLLLKRLIPFVERTGRVTFLPNTTIIEVTAKGQACAVRDALGNEYGAGKVIICTGADYRTLLPDHFRASGLQICKLQMMQTVPLAEVALTHNILSSLSIQRYPSFKSCPSYALLETQPVDQDLRDYGIHLLFKQAVDGSIIIGDSHEYRDCDEVHFLEETTNCAINEAILGYARTMLHLPSWEIESMWNGYYVVNPRDAVYTATVDEHIHIVTGIAGKGMSTGAGFARHSIEQIL